MSLILAQRPIQQSPLQQVFQIGGKHNPMREICSYLDETAVSAACKIFRQSNQQEMIVVSKQLLSRVTSLNLAVEGNLNLEEATEALRSLLPQLSDSVTARIPRNHLNYSDAFELFSEVEDCLVAGASDANKNNIFRYLSYLEKLKNTLGRDEDRHNPLSREENYNIFKVLCNALLHESLTKRFKKAVTELEQGNQPLDIDNPEKISKCLGALFQSQKQSATTYSQVHLLEFNRIQAQYAGNFSVERFMQQERLAHEEDKFKDSNYQKLWEAINGRFRLLQIDIGPNPPTTPFQIKRWMRLEENAAYLQRIDSLHIHGLSHIPPEIVRLTNLRELYCIGNTYNYLKELPLFLTNLPNLRCLDVGHNRIAIMPEPIHRHIAAFSPIFPDLCRYVLVLCTHRPCHIYIDHTYLKQIPFRMWFKIDINSPFQSCLSFTGWHNNAWGLLLLITLFMPLVVLNWLLRDLVEPIVSFFRNLLGYGNMIEVEPLQRG